MKTLRLLGSICVVLSLAALIGCFGAGLVPEDDGDGGTTVTVSISNAGQAEGETLLAYAYEAGEWITDMPEYVVGAGSATITDGTAEFVLTDSVNAEWTPTGDTWTATGGANYDLYIYTHAGGDLPMNWVLDPWPKTVAVDGDTTVEVDLSEFIAYEPTPGTLTVSVSGAQDQAGDLLFFGVLDNEIPPGPDANYLASGEVGISADGSANVTAIDATGAIWTGAADGDYDVYIFIDASDTAREGEPDDGDLIYDVAPVTYWQYGHKVMPTRYEDYETFSLPE